MSKTYLIAGISRKDMKIYAYADPAAANRAAEIRFADKPTTVASSEADLSGKSGPALVALYNGLIDEGVAPITRFTTRGDGARRVFALLVEKYSTQDMESESKNVAPGDDKSAGSENEEEDMAKGKKKAKAVRVKKERVAGPKKARTYQAEVVSKGSEKRKAEALEMIQRARGATAEEIAEKLELSLGTAKNLVWYLRRDNHKIVVDKTTERRPYIIG